MATQTLTIKLGMTGLASVTSGLRSIQATATTAVSALTRFAAPIAALASGAAIAGGIKSIASLGGKISDLSVQTGIGAAALIRYRQVFADAGKSADDVGSTISKLSKAIYDAASAGGEAEGALSRLGLSARQLSTLSPEAQFETMAKAINSVSGQTERSALAMQVFGKSGSEMLVVFDAMRDTTQTDGALGRLPEVLGRNVATLDAISDGFDQLKIKSQQFYAGLLDQVGPALRELVVAATQIDLTSAGQSVGAFVNLAVDAWRNGQFGEFVSLSLEAAFEQAGNAARRTFASLQDAFGGNFWGGVGVGLVTAANEGLKLIAEGITYLVVPFAAVSDYISDAFSFAFNTAANFLGERLKSVLNAAVDFMNEKLGTSFRGFTYSAQLEQAPDFGRSMAIAQSSRTGQLGWLNNLLDGNTAAARELAGFSAGTGETFDASNRLATLVEKMKADREESAREEGQITKQVQQQLPIAENLTKFREREAKAYQMLAENARSLTYAGNAADNYGQFTVAGMQEQANGSGGFGAGAIAGIQNSVAMLGTTASQVGNAIQTTIGGALDGISSSIEGLIRGTMRWADAFKNVGLSILNSVVTAFASLVAQMAVSFALQKLFGKAMQKQAMQVGSAWTSAAISASIATYGTAAGVGLGAFLAAQAAGQAASMGMGAAGGFRSGGYTGDVGVDQVAGVVHGREYVFDAPTVERIGLPKLEAIQSGADPAAVMGGGGSVNIAAFDSRMDARRWAQSQDSETWFVDMAARTSHRWQR